MADYCACGHEHDVHSLKLYYCTIKDCDCMEVSNPSVIVLQEKVKSWEESSDWWEQSFNDVCKELGDLKSKVKKFRCTCEPVKEECFSCLEKHHEHETMKLFDERNELAREYLHVVKYFMPESQWSEDGVKENLIQARNYLPEEEEE